MKNIILPLRDVGNVVQRMAVCCVACVAPAAGYAVYGVCAPCMSSAHLLKASEKA